MKPTFKNISRVILGFIGRIALAMVIVTAVILPESTMVANVGTFAIVIIAIHAVMLLIVSTLIPAEYATKTEMDVLEYQMWSPQVIAVLIAAFVLFASSLFLASVASYWTASILFASGLSHLVWPNYIKKIDIASKNNLIKSIQTA